MKRNSPQGGAPMRHNERDWDRLCDETDALMQTAEFPGRHEAFQEAARRNPHLNPTPPSPISVTWSGATGASSGVESELDRLTRELQHYEGGLTYAQAYARILAENPALYARYLVESQNQGGRRG